MFTIDIDKRVVFAQTLSGRVYVVELESADVCRVRRDASRCDELQMREFWWELVLDERRVGLFPAKARLFPLVDVDSLPLSRVNSRTVARSALQITGPAWLWFVNHMQLAGSLLVNSLLFKREFGDPILLVLELFRESLDEPPLLVDPGAYAGDDSLWLVAELGSARRNVIQLGRDAVERFALRSALTLELEQGVVRILELEIGMQP